MSSYKSIKIDVSPAKARKLANGKAVNLTAAEVKGEDEVLHVHPMNYEKLMKAKRANRGTRLQLTSGEIEHDMMQGGNIFKWLKKAAKTAYKFGKDNFDVIKPVLSRVADAAIPAAATAFGQPQFAPMARAGLKELTGVGIGSKIHPGSEGHRLGGRVAKGSPEAKARMQALRAKKRGGSFRLN